MYKKIIFSLIIIFNFMIVSVHASLFGINIEQNGEKFNISFNSLKELTASIETIQNQLVDKGFDPAASLTGGIIFKGLNITLNSVIDPITGVATLTYNIPGVKDGKVIGVDLETVLGSLGEEFINDPEILQKIFKAAAANTPVDPIAGNPSSLMARMVFTEFGLATNSPRDPARIRTKFTPYFARDMYNLNGKTINVDTLYLPLNHNFNLTKKGTALRFDMPLAVTMTDGILSADLQLGVALKIMIMDNWSITPGYRFGGGGSLGLLAFGFLNSYNITSFKTWNFFDSKLQLELINMFGYIQSMDFESLNNLIAKTGMMTGAPSYDLQNFVTKNGVYIKYMPTKRLGMRLGIADTYFMGSELYISHYNDIDFDLVIASGKNKNIDRLVLRGTYSFGEKEYQGYKFHFGFSY